MDFSLSEICIIVLVAFIVFGPEKLPDLARNAGRMIGKAKSVWKTLTTEIENTLAEAHSPDPEKKSDEK